MRDVLSNTGSLVPMASLVALWADSSPLVMPLSLVTLYWTVHRPSGAMYLLNTSNSMKPWLWAVTFLFHPILFLFDSKSHDAYLIHHKLLLYIHNYAYLITKYHDAYSIHYKLNLIHFLHTVMVISFIACIRYGRVTILSQKNCWSLKRYGR